MKIKFGLMTAIVLIAFVLMSGTAMAANEIYTVDDLKNIGNTSYNSAWTMNADYILMADITISDGSWVSIGNSYNSFSGTFDGNGKVITFTAETLFTKTGSSSDDGYGLFGNIHNDSVLKNVNIVAENNLTNGENSIFGVLVGRAYADSANAPQIINCSIEIKDGFTITGKNRVGLLGGHFGNATITGSSAAGAVKGTDFIGGLVGYTSGSVFESYASGTVDGNMSVGGLIGHLSGSSGYCIVFESYASGDVTGTDNVSGLVGYSSADISKSNASGTVDGNKHVGGLVGYFTGSNGNNISESHATGDVIGEGDYVGGLVGYLNNSSTISENYAAGTVTGRNRVGGLAGYLNNSSVSESYAVGTVNGNDRIGGLVGYLNNSSTITESYASGKVEGTSNVGGVVGMNTTSDVIDCFYIADNVDGTSYEGFGVADAELRKLTTFTEYADLTGSGWSIASSPDLTKTWYISEGKDYPKFYWQYQPVKTGGGSGTGSAIVINSTSSISNLTNETAQNSTSTSADVQQDSDNMPEEGYVEEPPLGADNPPRSWLLSLLIAVGLIIVIGGIAYYLYKKQKQS